MFSLVIEDYFIMFEDESDKFAESGKAKEDVDVPDEDVTNEDVQDNAEPDECVTDSGNCVMVADEFRRKLIENVMKLPESVTHSSGSALS